MFRYLFFAWLCVPLSAQYDPEKMPGDFPKTKIPEPKNGDNTLPFVDLEPTKSKVFAFSSDYFWGSRLNGHTTFKRNIDHFFEWSFDRLHYAFNPKDFHRRFALSYAHSVFTLPIKLLADAAHFDNAIADRIRAIGLTPLYVDYNGSSANNEYHHTLEHGSNMFSPYAAFFHTWYKDSLGRSLRRLGELPTVEMKREFEPHDSSVINEKAFKSLKKDQREKINKTSALYTQAEIERLKGYHVINKPWRINTLAAGYNSISDLMKEIEKKAAYGFIHYLDSTNYARYRQYQPLLSLLSAVGIHKGTIGAFTDLLPTDYTTPTKLCWVSLLTNFLSSTFYRTLKHVHSEYYTSSKLMVQGYFWRRLKIPDWHTYVTDKGLSISATSSLRVNEDIWIPFDVEFTTGGAGRAELEVGVLKKFQGASPFIIEGNALVSSKGLGGNFQFTSTIAQRFELKAGIEVYPLNTLKGRRRGTHSKAHDYSFAPFIQLGLTY